MCVGGNILHMQCYTCFIYTTECARASIGTHTQHKTTHYTHNYSPHNDLIGVQFALLIQHCTIAFPGYIHNLFPRQQKGVSRHKSNQNRYPDWKVCLLPRASRVKRLLYVQSVKRPNYTKHLHQSQYISHYNM